jgi:hypothetical protein
MTPPCTTTARLALALSLTLVVGLSSTLPGPATADDAPKAEASNPDTPKAEAGTAEAAKAKVHAGPARAPKAIDTKPHVDAIAHLKTERDLQTVKAELVSRIAAERALRRKAEQALVPMHDAMMKIGRDLDASRRALVQADLALKVACDGGSGDQTKLKTARNNAQVHYQNASVALQEKADDLAKTAHEGLGHRLQEACDEAALKTIEERLRIMENRKLAAGGTP